MTIDLYEIIEIAYNNWENASRLSRCGICKFIASAILNANCYMFSLSFEQTRKIRNAIDAINKPPKHYKMLEKRNIYPYSFGYFWEEYDDLHRRERFQQLLKHFKKPENRYLQV